MTRVKKCMKIANT